MIGKLSQIEQLGALLRQSEVKHQVVSSNIANVNTPHYKSKHVSFDEVLKSISQGQDPAKQAQVILTEGLVERQDGNNVDIDREMAELTKNAINYQTYTQLLTNKLGMYRSAISGR